MKYYVTGFMYSESKKDVALITKKQPEWQKGLLNGVGGKIEGKESPQEAMAREFEEETSVSTSPSDWKIFSIIDRPEHYKVHFLYCVNEKVCNVKTVEKEEVAIYKVDSLPENVIFNLNWLIPMSLDSELVFESPIYIEEIKRSR
ncbi:NUDIX domain-containing protein [Vibrio campbellii]|uniref:NUDIX hydrolase n=1 Tax=Vibrio campbellii TaxID=680 RepID=UPI00026C4EFD|nr:NUDIX domain-containing protein [Vibrio campbellii]AXB34278.1 NUDIX domain-containing protein [Vibrio campbellii]